MVPTRQTSSTTSAMGTRWTPTAIGSVPRRRTRPSLTSRRWKLSESTRIRLGCLSDVLVEFRPIRVFGIHFVPIASKDNGQAHARSLKTQPRGDRDCRAPRGRFFFGAGQNPHSEAKSI